MSRIPERAVVTGATSGIGEEITRQLAGVGMAVTMVGRSEDRLAAARARVQDSVPHADLHAEIADLSLLEDVRALAERLSAAPLPDVVISNAAVVTGLGDTTSDGIQRMLATNHLAPYVLLRSLAEALGERAARFVMVGASPRGLARVPVDLDDLGFADHRALGFPPSFRPFSAYARTKNMNAMFGYALARRLAGTAITVNGVHPGIIRGTGLGRETKGALRLFGRLTEVLPVSSGLAAGADTPCWLATSPEVEGVTGRFFVKRKQVETASHVSDVQRCDRLWDESARLASLAPELTLRNQRGTTHGVVSPRSRPR